MESDGSQSSEDFEILLESNDGNTDPRLSSLAIGCVISDKIQNNTGVLSQLRYFWSEAEVPMVKSFGGNLEFTLLIIDAWNRLWMKRRLLFRSVSSIFSIGQLDWRMMKSIFLWCLFGSRSTKFL